VALDRPDLKGREQILRVHAKPVTLSPAVDLSAIADRTPGSSAPTWYESTSCADGGG
jgi:cell division protease FtsH